MNYESIAKLVNDLFKNPQGLSSLEHEPLKVATPELEIIQNVFSKYGASGDTLTIEALPLVKWN